MTKFAEFVIRHSSFLLIAPRPLPPLCTPAVMNPYQLPLFCLALASAAAAGHPVLDSARRALDEHIPEIAREELTAAMRGAAFPVADRAAASLLLGEAQLRSGKPADALSVLEPLAGKKATLLRAHSLAAMGRWSEALPFYEDLAQESDAPASAAIGQAESLQVLGRTPEAVAVLEKLISTGKASIALRLRHAGLLSELGRKNEVEDLLRSIEPTTPSDIKWRDYVKARLLLANEQPQPALDALDHLVAEPEGLTPNLLAAVELARTDARLHIKTLGTETAAQKLEKFLWDNPESPAIEMIFRRLDQLNALDRNPREGELHKMADRDERTNFPRRGALAQFYVCRMQSREKSRKLVAVTSCANFLQWFPADKNALTTYVHELKADLAEERGDLEEALKALEGAQRTALDKERAALMEMRMGLVAYKKSDPSLAVTYFRLAAEHSSRLQKGAAFNAALAELGLKNLTGFQARLAEFTVNHSGDPLTGELMLEAGITQTRAEDPAAPATLRAFLKDFPAHPRRGEAHLVLAELQLASGHVAQATEELAQATAAESADPTGGQAERNQYAAIFAADAVQPRDAKQIEKITTLARSFIAERPKSPLLPEVRMKLAQVYFHENDFANAQTQFETLAREQPDGDYAESALFLAGQCAAKLMTPSSAERATALFTQVAERKGPLRYHALFQQGLIQNQNDQDASVIFQTILDAQPPAPPELRHATLCAKGDNLVRTAKGAPDKLGAALATYTQLAAIPDAGPEWHNQAVYRQGRVLIDLGRQQEALVVLTRLLDTATTGAKETFWLYKAGFDAAGILEGIGNWRGAFTLYEKLGKIPGARATEAQAKVKELRLKKFIWN